MLVPGFNYLLSLADQQLRDNLSITHSPTIPPASNLIITKTHVYLQRVTEAEKNKQAASEVVVLEQVPLEAVVPEQQAASEVVVPEQVPLEAVVPEQQAASEAGVPEQVPLEAVVQGQQVPPQAVVHGSDKELSVTNKGQEPSQAVTQGPEKKPSVSEQAQDQQMLGASEEHSTDAEPTTNQRTCTNAIVEGISRFLRDGEGGHLLRKGSEDSSYELSHTIEDQSWNEDSDDDPDHQQGIHSDEKN